MARYRTSAVVPSCGCGPNGRVRPDALLDLAQEVAGDHARTLGLAWDRLRAAGRSWAMARERLVVARWPGSAEVLTLETWPRLRERHVVHREIRIDDAEGREVASLSTAWVVLDLVTREAATGIDDLVADVAFDPEVAAGYPTRTIPALRGPGLVRTLEPRLADLDFNDHVAHARLAALVLEGVPRDVARARTLVDLDILFRAECRLEDRLVGSSAEVAPGRFRHRLARELDGGELVRAETAWT